MNENIVIQGARQNNLKDINLTIPRDKLVVFTGLSARWKNQTAGLRAICLAVRRRPAALCGIPFLLRPAVFRTDGQA